MKASRRNPSDILGVALVSVGALSLSLLGLVGFDLISEPFGSMMVLSRAVSSVAVVGILYQWVRSKSPKLVLVRVRA